MPSAALSVDEVGLAGSRMTPRSIPQQSQKSPNHQYLYVAHDSAHVCVLFPGGEQLLLKQPLSWRCSHTYARVPAWDMKAPYSCKPDLSPGVADILWKPQTPIVTLV